MKLFYSKRRKIYTLYIGVLILLFTQCNQPKQHYSLESFKAEYERVISDSNKVSDSQIEAIINPYRDKMKADMNKVVGMSNAEMQKSKPSGALNNIVSDMLLDVIRKKSDVDIDFCLINYGGLRRPLPKGKILKSDIFQLMPFQNEAVLVKVNPQGMANLFKYLYLSGGQPISGMKVIFNDSVNFEAKIKNQDWDSTKSYWVLTSDYTANGGDRMDFFAQKDSTILTGQLIRNTIFTYLDSLQKANLALEKDTISRIIFE
jgi:2',3'-cyclic-nucleotide 2'-phosphodiesterase (5'-nucleotidase family)